MQASALGVAVPGAIRWSELRSAAAQEGTPAADVVSGGTLRVIIVDDPNFLDILVTQLMQVRNLMGSVYETLTYLDASDPAFPATPRLAKSWEFTEPNILDMQLQEGVTFHEGQEFTAEDVKWTIEYIKNPDTGSPHASVIEVVDSVEVLDPLQVRFNLKNPWPALPQILTAIQIYSQTATPESIAEKPNGTGPFTWQEWVPGDHITLAKNPNYWIPGQPYLDTLEFRPIKEKATSLSVMEAGDADVFITPELKDKALIDGNENLKSAASLSNDSGYILYMNQNRAPMNDQNLRLAVSYALDRRTFFEAFLSGQGQKNTSPWAATQWSYNPINDDAFEYDLERARGYLEAAGYTDGKSADGTQLSINVVYPQGYPEWRQGSEMFQAAMAELGVDVKVEELELATWIDRIVKTDEYDLSWDYHFQRAVDPAWTLTYAFFYPPGPQNISRYTDDQITELINAGGIELDEEKRRDTYFQFQERWNEICPGIIVGEFPFFHALAADVEGFVTDPFGFQDFRTVWLNR